MNTFHVTHAKGLLDQEELESLEMDDFDDVLPRFEASKQENESDWSISFGWTTEDRFH